MKILKQLSNSFIFLFFVFHPLNILSSNEPVDIWNIEKKDSSQDKIKIQSQFNESDKVKSEITIDQQNEKIIVNDNLNFSDVKLAGLYDPEDNGLAIDMWTNSDGKNIKKILDTLKYKNLSEFSERVLDIALLTNSYIPNNNISSSEFLNFKYEFLVKKKNFDLIKNFLLKNPNLKENEKLVEFYANHYLSNSQPEKACEIFDLINLISNDYLTNFKIYCLIYRNKKEEAQLLFDLNSELGNLEKFFTNKFNILMGYKEPNAELSEKNILYFHLSHKTVKDFEFDPKIDTSKLIWNYLSTSNLLKGTDLTDITNDMQMELIEMATNDGIYEEKDLFNLYTKFQFDINQLLNYGDAYKVLKDHEARALLYQRYLLSNDINQKLNLLSLIKKLFDKSNLSFAFDETLLNALKKIPEKEIPSNYTSFYEKNKQAEKLIDLKIKLNNKILHQSKILNYFQNKISLQQVEKETNDLLKKIKNNKKYVFSLKDIIMLESLKSDGVQIAKKYQKLYEYENNLPTDINSMIVNGETGLVLLKIAQIVGEDDLENLGIESVDYIVGILNELKLVDLRNEILLKILPLKV